LARRASRSETLGMVMDEYGLPSRILGSHPEELYGAVGRVVCVAAVSPVRQLHRLIALSRWVDTAHVRWLPTVPGS